MPVLWESWQPDQALPMVARPSEGDANSHASLCDWIREHRSELDAKRLHHGAVLFRGWAVHSTDQFSDVASAVTSELKPYVEGQSPRTKLTKDVYTSTEFPARFRITLHNELSYALNPPAVIIFGCEIPAHSGGETPIVDCRLAYQSLDPAVRDRFGEKGVLYVKHMHGQTSGMGKSWMAHFETSDRLEVETYLRDNDVSFTWLADGTLRTEARRPGVRQHPVTGEWIWFNQSNLWHVGNLEPTHREQMLRTFGEDRLPTHARYGDGTEISLSDLQHVQDVLWGTAVIFPWQAGDVLVLDNYLVAHGRMPFEGPRRILVAMGGESHH